VATMTDEQRKYLYAVYGMFRMLPAIRYVRGLERRKEIVPKSAERILLAVARSDDTAIDRFLAVVEYVEAGPGQKYLTGVGDDCTPEIRKILSRLGVPDDVAERFHADHAAAFAGKTGQALHCSVFKALASARLGEYLGLNDGPVRRVESTPAEEAMVRSTHVLVKPKGRRG
jgi:hypothetical protein